MHGESAMIQLTWWMRLVGSFYVLLGVFNTPLIIEARLSAQYPNLDVSAESVAARALIDTWFMFGLEVGVIGIALLYFSRNPIQNTALVWTVLGLEVIRGVVDDMYLLARGYEPGIYVGWIVIHLIIIVTGVLALRAAHSAKSRKGDAGDARPAGSSLARPLPESTQLHTR
jgi:hypothetical protein